MRDPRRYFITYRALRDIKAGEELCALLETCLDILGLTLTGISYGSRLTFTDVDTPLETSPQQEEEELEHLRMIQPY